ncbi:MAG: hypothetical protein JWO71_4588 [Candidatus Acidoferrum typicum]|nr:hypothetical protein [Candidatus Acidoferrum typicum]
MTIEVKEHIDSGATATRLNGLLAFVLRHSMEQRTVSSSAPLELT